MSKRKTLEQFVAESKVIHGNRYDYSKVNYSGDRIKVCIICPYHGEFWQAASSHLQGSGCRKCAIQTRIKPTAEIIRDFAKVHGNRYDYSRMEYINAMTKITILCPIHGKFLQEPHSHLKGQGCPECCRKNRMDTKEDFIKKAILAHGNKPMYDYSKVVYVDCDTKVCIVCPKHGEFWQAPNIHLMGCNCQKCNKVVLADGTLCDSRVEAYRYLFHKNNGIPFLHNKRYGNELGRMRYDFYFPSLKIYEEVTSFDLSRDAVGFNKRIRLSYIDRLNKKKRYVESMGCKFQFVKMELTPYQQE